MDPSVSGSLPSLEHDRRGRRCCLNAGPDAVIEVHTPATGGDCTDAADRAGMDASRIGHGKWTLQTWSIAAGNTSIVRVLLLGTAVDSATGAQWVQFGASTTIGSDPYPRCKGRLRLTEIRAAASVGVRWLCHSIEAGGGSSARFHGRHPDFDSMRDSVHIF
jgi:hypothetical protein